MALFLTGCNDDDDPAVPTPEPAIAQLVKGQWSNNFTSEEYYDLDGNVVYADSADVDVRFNFKGNNVDISHPGVEGVDTWVYTFPKQDNENYIYLSQTGKTSVGYDILHMSADSMVWMNEIQWASYDDGSGEETSAKGVYIYRFIRQE
ncbi:hypothetical protein DXT99_18100 [Pontibacter diazotrophicus]|uniref:Lipocalin-like domain-containing protein n=1 Tax=Pontibacter diazotrophicus TaxID=1400979 RepID=A0A3D8L8M8_9BACT|nr:hypothetical protein [Pontibacter diazotrophicus]RDV13683.1 hypothetical protein DXT99_18100 [Pontibacter diazotrophicus]